MRHLISLVFILCVLGSVAAQESAIESIPDAQNEQPTPVMPPRPKVEVEFTPVEKVLENTPIRIGVKIPATREGDQVFLHFREAGRLDFNSTPMGYNPMSKNYETEIDERFHGKEKVEYYIEVFPVNHEKIRLPEAIDGVYSVVTYTSFNDIMRVILICIVIPSPIFIAYMISRFRKAHQKRTVAYQQRLKSRERQLTKQREKHYQEYVKKMTGGKSTPGRTDPGKPATTSVPTKPAAFRGKSPEQTRPGTFPAEVKPAVEPVSEMMLENTDQTSDELKRELDEILSGKSSEPTPPPGTPPRKLPLRPPKSPPSPAAARSGAPPPRQDAQRPRPPQQPPLKPPTRPAPPAPSQNRAPAETRQTPGRPPVPGQPVPQKPLPAPKSAAIPKTNPGPVHANTPEPPIKKPVVPARPAPVVPQKPATTTAPAAAPTPAPAQTQPSIAAQPKSSPPVKTGTKPAVPSEKKKQDTRTEREKLLDLLGLDDL